MQWQTIEVNGGLEHITQQSFARLKRNVSQATNTADEEILDVPDMPDMPDVPELAGRSEISRAPKLPDFPKDVEDKPLIPYHLAPAQQSSNYSTEPPSNREPALVLSAVTGQDLPAWQEQTSLEEKLEF
ncbi:hypothetical protein P170DRAFT_427657 [Aspergillus steynii IBT 23096]|uniref:Uncharacterized protein n=1 Tax=Aspergillus steynii IBT 23096 TaxID=1392250 RepID=A0A2I2G0A6_9EURO|nr:uncharacterized protein P170DRAFT_427657 [Aspergillus steynii IBT 23096]PLB46322.1 hypothetical protein P170DRAFT_427657 [Aspergillus steynii IBT 23096]